MPSWYEDEAKLWTLSSILRNVKKTQLKILVQFLVFGEDVTGNRFTNSNNEIFYQQIIIWINEFNIYYMCLSAEQQ